MLFMETTEMVDSAAARRHLGKRLGKRLSEIRKGISWTQQQLAERVGVDAETISRFERGAALPSLLTLDQLARALRKRTADLLEQSSIQPIDQAVRISALLEDLSAR